MRAYNTSWMGCPEVADRLGVSVRTVYGMINRGELAAYHMGRVIRVKRADLQGFLVAQRLRPGDLDHLLPGSSRTAGQEANADSAEGEEPTPPAPAAQPSDPGS